MTIILQDFKVDDDGFLTIPPEILEELGWKEGDEIEIDEGPDGSLRMRKVK
jgi:AbrB family looped-hinge helix DNA binding protein